MAVPDGDADIQFIDPSGDGPQLSPIQPTARPFPMAREGLYVEKRGRTYRNDVPIFIHEDTLTEIVAYSGTSKTHELGGMMLGGLHCDQGVTYLEIDRYFVARHVDSHQASIKFTHATWEDVHRRREQEAPPGTEILGWHHTHPGYGIFLSRHDLFIHENFFAQLFHVALVVDPRARRLGFFRWRNGEIRLTGFFVVRKLRA